MGPTMNTAKYWIFLIRAIFYGAAVLALLLPFAVLFVFDPDDRADKHLYRFVFFPLVGMALAIIGKLIATALEALVVYIQKNQRSTLSQLLELPEAERARLAKQLLLSLDTADIELDGPGKAPGRTAASDGRIIADD
jgi:hypothetical protein